MAVLKLYTRHRRRVKFTILIFFFIIFIVNLFDIGDINVHNYIVKIDTKDRDVLDINEILYDVSRGDLEQDDDSKIYHIGHGSDVVEDTKYKERHFSRPRKDLGYVESIRNITES